jgi:hypothetical protein
MEVITELHVSKFRHLTSDLHLINRITSAAATGMNGGVCDVQTIDHFCSQIRFPNTTSFRVRQRAYLIRCLSLQDESAALLRLLPPDLMRACCGYCLGIPCINSLSAAIQSTQLYKNPFPQIHAFKSACLKSFAQKQRYLKFTIFTRSLQPSEY